MYLSLLTLDPRSRRALTEASRPYELHRSLMRAFPDEANGGPGRVLFRLDADRQTGDVSVLVQSEKEPLWAKVNGAAGFVIEHKCKEFMLISTPGQVLRFRLRANPTRRSKTTGKRQGIFGENEQIKWLCQKGQQGGFEVINVSALSEGFSKDRLTDKSDVKHETTMLSVRFDGLLRITDTDTFHRTICEGIGSAKGFGFGLLSIAPVN